MLTKSSQAAAENFPFCTIDPNEVILLKNLREMQIFFQARVAVPDERWDWLVAHHKPASKVVLYDISICSQKSLIFVEFL